MANESEGISKLSRIITKNFRGKLILFLEFMQINYFQLMILPMIIYSYFIMFLNKSI